MIELKRFEKSDWFSFAGAEKFEDGSEPLVGWIKVSFKGCDEIDLVAYVIWDKNGLVVGWEDVTYECIDHRIDPNCIVDLTSEMTIEQVRELSLDYRKKVSQIAEVMAS